MDAPNNDRWTIRAVAIVLGAVGLVVVVAGALLAWDAKTLPDGVLALGSAALGAHAALLANTRA